MAEEFKGLPVLVYRSQATFDRWVERHHGRDDGVWLKFAKKGSAKRTLSYEQAREAAISWGWIDGLKHKWDEDYYVLRFTPRRRRSRWSQINREIAESLIAAGAMRAPGLAQVEAAKADGRWEAAYAGSATIEEPPDLLAAIEKSKAAQAHYGSISRSARFQIIYQVLDAKREATRQRRIERFVEMLARGESP